MNKLRLGDIGEDLASAWASQAGFTVTPVRRDRRGWDHFLEFSAPGPPSSTGPLGFRTLEFSAKLQVKATCSPKRSVSIKLSNLQRAINDLLPWFFLVVRVDKTSSQPLEVALVHVGNDLIEAVLRRLLGLPRSERSTLHKHRMRLSWKEVDILAQPYPDSIREFVFRSVGKEPLSYVQEKRRWYDSAGLEEAPVHATFRVQASTEQELYMRLARAAIGLEDTLEVSNFAIVRRRFDVEETDERFTAAEQGGFLSIGPSTPEQTSTLIVSYPDGSRAVALRASERFSAAVFPMLPMDFWLLRLQAPLLDIVLDVGASRFNFRLDLPSDDKKVSLGDLLPAFGFLRFLHEAKGLPLVFQLEKDGQTIPIGTLDSMVELNPERLRVIRWVCAIASLVRDLGADHRVDLSLREVYEYGPIAEFMIAARRRTQISVRVETTIPGEALEAEKPVAIITNPVLRIGSLIYAEIATFSGPPRVLSADSGEIRIRVESSSPRSLESFLLSENQARTFAWDEALERASATLEAEGFENIFTAPWRMKAWP